MQNILIKCPRCRQQKLKKNGTRNGGQVQQYRCLHCRRQRSESNDELIRCLCDFGHDVRRHGAITAVAFYFLGYSLLAIEKKTGVKSETLKRILKILRNPKIYKACQPIIKEKAKTMTDNPDGLDGAFDEFELREDLHCPRHRIRHQIVRCSPVSRPTTNPTTVA